MTVHDFRADLAKSEALGKRDDFWFPLYHRAFAGTDRELIGCRFNTDTATQRQGIDRYLDFEGGYTETVDDKVERRDFSDFLLEVWSDEESRAPGWVLGEKVCDWLGWVVPGHLWVLSYAGVFELYRDRKHAWKDADYPVRRVRSRSKGRYTTVSVSVPRREVLAAVEHHWAPIDGPIP